MTAQEACVTVLYHMAKAIMEEEGVSTRIKNMKFGAEKDETALIFQIETLNGKFYSCDFPEVDDCVGNKIEFLSRVMEKEFPHVFVGSPSHIKFNKKVPVQ